MCWLDVLASEAVGSFGDAWAVGSAAGVVDSGTRNVDQCVEQSLRLQFRVDAIPFLALLSTTMELGISRFQVMQKIGYCHVLKTSQYGPSAIRRKPHHYVGMTGRAAAGAVRAVGAFKPAWANGRVD